MRTLLFFCAVALVSACTVQAQSLSDIIDPSKRSHDFGAVPRAGKFEHHFELHNPFNTDMHLRGARSSCGCTTPILNEYVIKPGQSVPLIAKFNSDNLQLNGKKRATVTVSIASPISAELQLNVEGYIRTDVVLNPGVVAFGKIAEGETKKVTVELNYAGRNDWKIQRLTSPFSFIKADFAEVKRSGGQVRYQVDVEIDGNAPDGYIENLLVAHTNDHRLTTFPIRLTATVEKPIDFSPKNVDLEHVKPKESISQSFAISRKGKPFQILEITSDIAEIDVELPAKPSEAYFLELKIAPHRSDGDSKVHGHIFVKTNISDEPFKIPMSVLFEVEKLAEVR